MSSRRVAWTAAATGLVALSVAAAPSFGGPAKLHFGKPVVVDAHLAGGEPSIFWDPRHQDFIYSSHEGTTHTLRDGLAGAAGTADFTTNYRNQVNIWTSKDGRSWSRVDLSGTGFEANPSTNQGFSDPDLTQDAGGRVYNTGIDLANDALFSTNDGGGFGTCANPSSNLIGSCSRPTLQGGVSATVLERIRVQATFNLYFPARAGQATQWAFGPGIGVQWGY